MIPSRPRNVVEAVLSVVVNHYGIALIELRGRGRSQSVAYARHVAMFLMRKMTPMSYEDISLALGRTDHTTAMDATQKVERFTTIYPGIKTEMFRLERQVRQMLVNER